jgi:hypothetical protein
MTLKSMSVWWRWRKSSAAAVTVVMATYLVIVAHTWEQYFILSEILRGAFDDDDDGSD